MNAQIVTCALSGVLLCTRYRKQFDSFLQRLCASLNYLTTPMFYIFFDEYSMPFPAYSLHFDRLIGAEPTVVYNADASVFFPYHETLSFADILARYKAVPFPILSMEIVDSSKQCVRDITGFIETIRYIHIPNYAAPTISDIVAAWSVINSIPIDRDKFRVRYITVDGDELDVSLTDTSSLHEDPLDPINQEVAAGTDDSDENGD